MDVFGFCKRGVNEIETSYNYEFLKLYDLLVEFSCTNQIYSVYKYQSDKEFKLFFKSFLYKSFASGYCFGRFIVISCLENYIESFIEEFSDLNLYWDDRVKRDLYTDEFFGKCINKLIQNKEFVSSIKKHTKQVLIIDLLQNQQNKIDSFPTSVKMDFDSAVLLSRLYGYIFAIYQYYFVGKTCIPVVENEFRRKEGKVIMYNEGGIMKPYKVTSVKITAITPMADAHIERCARICYRSEDKPQKGIEFLKKLMESGHTSIFEHASLTYELGLCRVGSHQDVRHRHKSPSQESQRVVKISKENYIIPVDVIKQGPEAIKMFEDTWRRCLNTYYKLIEMGVKKQDARYIIPNSAKTKIANTLNFRSLIDTIFPQRIEKHAQWEIKSCYIMLLTLLLTLDGCNGTFKAFLDLGFLRQFDEEVKRLRDQGFRFKFNYEELEGYCYIVSNN